jgi:hypothetical protein
MKETDAKDYFTDAQEKAFKQRLGEDVWAWLDAQLTHEHTPEEDQHELSSDS